MCRQSIRTDGPIAGYPLYLAIDLNLLNRPSPDDFSKMCLFHFGFSAASENLQWRLAVPGQRRPTTRTGRRSALDLEDYWRDDFGLTPRKAPHMATVALGDGAADALPALAALRDLVRSRRGPHPIAFQNERRPE